MYTYWPQDILIPVDFLNQRVDHYLQELSDFATGMEWAETIFLCNMNDCLITHIWITMNDYNNDFLLYDFPLIQNIYIYIWMMNDYLKKIQEFPSFGWCSYLTLW